jgi:hypothetical protein
MLPNVPIPVERVVAPPKTDQIKKEDDAEDKKVDDWRKEPPKEPFDSHLHRLMPPGWSPSPEVPVADFGAIAPETLLAAPRARPGWLMKAIGDLGPDTPLPDSRQTVALHVPAPQSLYSDHEILSAMRDGAPIHEVHFPALFAAQVARMQVAGEPVTHLSVQIAPEHLGTLQLHFTLKEQTVAVSVLAATREAKEAVERQMGAIEGILSAHQFKPTELKVEVASQGAETGGGGQSSHEGAGYETPNRWLMRRRGDLDEGIDVAL